MKWKVWNLKRSQRRRTNPAGLDRAQGSAPSAQSAHQCSVNAGAFSCRRAEEEEEQLLIKVSLAPRLSGSSSGMVGEKTQRYSHNKKILAAAFLWKGCFLWFWINKERQSKVQRKCWSLGGFEPHPSSSCMCCRTNCSPMSLLKGTVYILM